MHSSWSPCPSNKYCGQKCMTHGGGGPFIGFHWFSGFRYIRPFENQKKDKMFGTRGGVGHNYSHSFDGLYLKESLQEFLNPLSIIPPWLKFLSGIPAAIPSGTAHQKNERSCGLPPLVPNILFFF